MKDKNNKLDVYISFWGFKDFDVSNPSSDMEFIVSMMVASFFYASEHYENVYLVTDTKSKSLFLDIPFTKIYTTLDELNELDSKYHRYWSLGKIKTMEFAAKFNRPFVQIDYDVFLRRPLPEWLTSADLFCQSPEPVSIFPYNLNIFYDKFKYLGYSDTRSENAYNCGIFGVNNLEFIKKFSKSAFEFVIHKDNDWVFDLDHDKENYNGSHMYLSSSSNNLAGFQCAIWIEQYYLACAAQKEKINVKLLFDIWERNEEFSELAGKYGYIHLMEGKKNPIRIDQINEFAKKVLQCKFNHLKVYGVES